MKLPRGKIKLNSLTECSAGRKVEILYETFEREDEIKNFDQMLYRKEKQIFFMKLSRQKVEFESLTICGTGTGRKIEINYETSERDD